MDWMEVQAAIKMMQGGTNRVAREAAVVEKNPLFAAVVGAEVAAESMAASVSAVVAVGAKKPNKVEDTGVSCLGGTNQMRSVSGGQKMKMVVGPMAVGPMVVGATGEGRMETAGVAAGKTVEAIGDNRTDWRMAQMVVSKIA